MKKLNLPLFEFKIKKENKNNIIFDEIRKKWIILTPKWIEGYLDLGMLKDDIGESRYFYGSGIRLNLLPDFFELYFPVSSSNGFELDDYRYYNNIRFIVSYNIESLGKLFSRRWL